MRLEGRGRDRAGEAQLDLVVGEVAQGVDPVDLDQPAVADDRHPVAGLLDLATGCGSRGRRSGRRRRPRGGPRRRSAGRAGRGPRSARRAGAARAGAGARRRGRPSACCPCEYSLKRRARVEVEALDQRLPGRPGPRRRAGWRSSRASGRRSAGRRGRTRRAGSRSGDGSRPGRRVRLDAEDEGLAAGRPDQVEERPDRRRLAGAVRARGSRRPRPARRSRSTSTIPRCAP